MLTPRDWFTVSAFCFALFLLSWCATDIPTDTTRTLRNPPAALPPAVLDD